MSKHRWRMDVHVTYSGDFAPRLFADSPWVIFVEFLCGLDLFFSIRRHPQLLVDPELMANPCADTVTSFPQSQIHSQSERPFLCLPTVLMAVSFPFLRPVMSLYFMVAIMLTNTKATVARINASDVKTLTDAWPK